MQWVSQNVSHAVWIPAPAAFGRDAPAGQSVSDPCQRVTFLASASHLPDDLLLRDVGDQPVPLTVEAVGRGTIDLA
jgi:hypothetical protein